MGTWQFSGDWGPVDRQEGIAALRRAVDLGFNFVDTADVYGFGVAEEMVRQALHAQIRRGEVIVATKGGLRWDGQGRVWRDSSPAYLRQAVDASLRRLGVETIDLYQVHWPDPEVPISETAGVLDELVKAGKIRYVGVSNYDRAELMAFTRVRPLDAYQPPYSLLNRTVEYRELRWCQQNGVGVLVYGALAHGLLGGSRSFPTGDWRANAVGLSGRALERNLQIVERLRGIAAEFGRTIAELAVAWVLNQPGVHVAIVGARRPAHVESIVRAAEWTMDPALVERIEQAAAGANPVPGLTPEGP